MKICELKIQGYSDREKLASALFNSGYKVSLDIRQGDTLSLEYYVIVEDDKLSVDKELLKVFDMLGLPAVPQMVQNSMHSTGMSLHDFFEKIMTDKDEEDEE